MLRELLSLKKPLVCLDVETHAKVPPERARIVEIGLKVFYPDGREKEWESYVNPGVPIAPSVTALHGITDEQVKDAPYFSQMAANLAQGFQDCAYCGYNVRFDLRVLAAEMKLAGVDWSYEGAPILDPLRIWQISAPRTLSDAVREFCGREPRGAHRALNDTLDAIDVAVGQFHRFDKLPKDVNELHTLCFTDTTRIDIEGKIIWVEDVACFGFGKYSGVALKDVKDADPGYLHWMCGHSFADDTKRIITEALNGNYPTRTA